MKLARELVSTTYILLTIITVSAFIIFMIIIPYVNWSNVYNQDNSMQDILKWTTTIVISFFLIRLVVGLIGTILTSHLKPAWSQALNTTANFLVIATIWVLSKFIEGDLVLLATILSLSSVLVYLVASLILYNGKLKNLSPSIRYFRRKHIKTILGLGINFFIINISTIIIFQANNFLIIHLFNNEDVVVYNLAYKLFSVCSILFGLISQPFWTAYTDAWTKEDTLWIKTTLKRIFKIWIAIICLGLFLLLLSPIIYKIWIGDKVSVPFILSTSIFAYFISHTYGGIYNIFINGIGKIKLQVICLGIVALIYIPMVLFFVKVLNLGLISIPLAQLLSNFYSMFIARIQYNKIISGTAIGIWNK